MPEKLLQFSDVLSLTGLSKSTIRRFIADGRFPRPLAIGPRRRAWRAEDVTKWLDGLAAARDAA